MPVSVPCHRTRQIAGRGVEPRASERMKLGRAPAHPQSQAPVSSRAGRPYEGQPGTCLAWESRIMTNSRRGENRTPTPRGHVLLSPRVYQFHHLAVDQWSVRESNPPLQLEGLVSLPIDERTLIENRQWVVKELNLPPSASQLDGNGFTGRREEHHPSEPSRVARVGVEPTESPGLSLAALPVCVPCRPLTYQRPRRDLNPRPPR